MSDIIYSSKYQNLHMDRARPNSMITVNFSVNTNLAYDPSPRLLYEYAHGYNYTPQFWGLWDVKYGAGLDNILKRGYGYISRTTAVATTANFYYEVDYTHVRIYFHFDGLFPASKPNPSGTTGTFTGYVFANDRINQTYQ